MPSLTAVPCNPVDLEQRIEAFEQAWKRHGSAALSDFLPPGSHPSYSRVLCELVRVDLELRWSHGDRRRIDAYLDQFSILGEDHSFLQEIAYEEYRQRLQAGEQVDSREYAQRYAVDIDSWPSGDKDSIRTIDLGTRQVSLEDVQRSFSMENAPARLKVSAKIDHTSMPKIGDKVLNYRLIAKLGDGSFGQVFLAEQVDLSNRKVALKVTPVPNAEPQMLAELQHTNIVPINSVHRVGSLQIICMPFHGSTTLKHVIDSLGGDARSYPSTGRAFLSTLFDRSKSVRSHGSGTRPGVAGDKFADEMALGVKTLQELDKLAHMTPVEASLRILAGVADGLIHAHERGLIHRDLKPANILLADDGTPMLLDFNLAADVVDVRRMNRVRMGGTFPYMAPEQLEAIRDKKLSRDPRSDLFALGVVLFEMLTGRHPFPKNKCVRSEFLDQMLVDRRRAIPDPRAHNPGIPAAVVSILQRLLEADPARRYQTAGELKEDLERQLSDRPLKFASEPSLRERAAKFRRRRPRAWTALWVSTAALLFVLAPATIIAVRQDEIARRTREKERAEALVLLGDSLRKTDDASAFLRSRNHGSEVQQRGVTLLNEISSRYQITPDQQWLKHPDLARLTESERAELLTSLGSAYCALSDLDRMRGRDLGDGDCLSRAEHWRQLADHCFRAAGAKSAPAGLDDVELYAAACDELSAGRFRKAGELLTQLTDRNPAHFMAWFMKGQCHEQIGQDTAAAEAFTVCIALKPDFAWSYFNRACILARGRWHARADHDFTKAIDLDGNLVEARVRRALVRRELGNIDGALADLTAALATDSAPIRAWFIRSAIYRRQGKLAEAERDHAHGMKFEPADDLSWATRGFYRIKDDPEGALQDFDRALAINPRCRSALQNKAHVLGERLQKPAEANRVLDQLIEYYPECVAGHAGRGVNYARAGQIEDARREAELCLTLDSSAATCYQVGCLYAQIARTDPTAIAEAVRLLGEALKRGLNKPDQIASDKDLDPLRDDPEFQRLLRVARDLEKFRNPAKKPAK